VLGRPADPGGLANATQALANGTSLTELRADLADSVESRANIEGIYDSMLGRPSDLGGLDNAINTLAAGTSLAALRADIAAGPEAQADLQWLYESVLGRAADAGGLATFTQVLASSGYQLDVQEDLANSAEAASDITNAFVAATGSAPNAVQLAGAQSLLQSGVRLAWVEGDTASAGGMPDISSEPYLRVPITPETVGTEHIFGLLNDAQLIAAQPGNDASIPYSGDSATGVAAFIYNFNPATDMLQIDTRIVPTFSALDYFASGSGTVIDLGTGQSVGTANSIYLYGVPPASLTAANFRFS